MYKHTVTYTDFNDVERTEDIYFNLSKADILGMENEISGGMKQRLEKIIASKDNQEIYKILVSIIEKAYGRKSDDGKRFIKTADVLLDFQSSPAYDEFLLWLLANETNATVFMNAVIPKVEQPSSPAPLKAVT